MNYYNSLSVKLLLSKVGVSFA